jgi:hypothetical protein
MVAMSSSAGRDAGADGPALGACVALQAVAAVTILLGPGRSR